MSEKKNIIINCGWYGRHLLVDCHQGEVIIDNKLQEADVVDEILREWWVDNTCRYSFISEKSLKTFRGHIAQAKRGYYFKERNPKDKRIIVYNKEGEWWELFLKDKELYPTRIKIKTENFDEIFNEVYASKYKKYQQFEFSEEHSPTKKMKLIKDYLNVGK